MGEQEERQLRDALEQALICQPEAMTTDLLDHILGVPMKERYRKLDVKGLLRGGAQNPPLRSVITALNILEKYGRNLLSPLRPKFWRSVKFNNPVFKTTVDAIEGGRHVLSLYGYSCALPDGLSFPESMQEPDCAAVASITADVIILHRELNLLISNSHPRQKEAEQELLGCNLLQRTLVADATVIPQAPLSVSGPVACCLCGSSVVSTLCSSCNETHCAECDQRIHSRPNRSQHQRSPYGPAAVHRPLEQSTLSPLSSRPPWQCHSCRTLNMGTSVLCVGCDRPRACASSPSNLSLGGQVQRDTWECQACTLQNSSSAVLCAVCDRPRLASKPSRDSHDTVGFPKMDTLKMPLEDSLVENIGPLIDNTVRREESLKQEGWQCSHCTYYNMTSHRVCEMCDRTREETPSTVGCKPRDVLSHEQEEVRQRSLREDGEKLVALIREGEGCDVPPEEVFSAVQYSGTEKPLHWLQTELPCVLERVMDSASQRVGSELGALTHEEARSAWVSSGGIMEDAVTLCVSERRCKVVTLCNLGFTDKDKVVSALYESAGDVGKALSVLQTPLLAPFLTRIWEDSQPPIKVHSDDRQATVRRLLAEHALPSWGRAELALSLLQEGEGRFTLQDVLEAVRESHDRDFIKRMLTQECSVCGWELPRNKMRSLTSCECCICPDCFRTHFTVAVKEKHIRDMVCPTCEQPEISDERELLHYFSTLDILLRDTLEVDAYNLFHKKLTERTLMKDPKFLWCTHCSFGFIYERDQLDVKCPQCDCSFCRNCKRPWEEQHRSLSCEAFQNWKRENDTEYQAQGLAVYLQENGITCPHCKFSYALARGGCMHFICSQCRHQFCSGCYNTFHPKNKCIVPSCTVRMSLHAHHPRDCLFYLRDWEVPRLQRLLQQSQVQFNTDPPAGTQAGPGGGCRVMEQKETLEGLNDEACGKETAPGYAGLCESHYKEYLVSRINGSSVDPCVLYDLAEATTVCQRYLPLVPPREPNENDANYRDRLLRVLISEVPLSVSIPRKKHS
ncbi:E3 ubiquitin-protein ligase RNF31 isoform 2-T3 [Discoglossus pictus]